MTTQRDLDIAEIQSALDFLRNGRQISWRSLRSAIGRLEAHDRCRTSKTVEPRELSDAEQMVLMAIHFAEKKGLKPSASEIAADTELTETEVTNAISYLSYIGLIRQKGDGA